MNRNTVFRSGCFAHASVAVLLIGAGCTSRVDLAQERASSAAAAAPGEPLDATSDVGGGSSAGGSGGSAGSAMRSDASTEFECAAPLCMSLPIRAQTDPTHTPYQIAPGEEAYECFGYHIGQPEMQAQIVAFSPLIDNPQIVHGFDLFAASTRQVNGSYAICTDAPPQGVRVYHWAPGTGPLVLPSGSEIPLEWDAVLAVHYINTSGAQQFDTSGVSACVCGMI
jgi:hypothetical protein